MMSFFLSLRNKRRSQSALEYLLIYGWMFAVIIVVGASLWYLGIFNPNANQEQITEQSFESSVVGVSDHVLYSTGEWKIGLISRGYNLFINYICLDNYCFNINSFLGPRESKIVSGSFGFELNDSTQYMYNMMIDYTRLDSGLDHRAYGIFSGFVEHREMPSGMIVYDYEYDFSPGTFVNTTSSLFSGYVSLSLKDDWYDYSFPSRKRYVIEWNGSEMAYPITIDANGIDVNLLVVDGEKIAFYQNGTKLSFSTFFNKGNHVVDLYYGLPLQPQSGSSLIVEDDGKIDNGKITIYLGNRNNPSQWGIDSLYLDSEGIDYINYNSFLLNYSTPLNYSFVCESPLFCTARFDKSSIRVFSNSSLFRYYFNSSYLYLGTDNSVLNCVEDYCFYGKRTELEFNNRTYIWFYNESTGLSLVLYFPEQRDFSLHLSGFNNESNYIVFNSSLKYVDILLLSGEFEPPLWRIVSSHDEKRFNSRGYYISPIIDSGFVAPDYSYLRWYSTGNVYLSIRAGTTVEECNNAQWYGPIGGYYYSTNGTIPSSFDGKRYIQYKAHLSTDNEETTSMLDRVEIVMTR